MIRLAPLASLAAALTLAAPLAAQDLGNLSDSDRAAFRAEVRAYLLENPEVLMEAIGVLEQREAAAKDASDSTMIAANAEAIFNDGYSWVGGNPDGDITLVEFVDYRCGYCRRAAEDVKQLIETDGNIRLIMKEFPILGEASTLSSRFAIATKMVAGDAAYGQMHDALITFQGNPGTKSLRRLASGLGLDGDAILARMSDPEIDRILAANRALAQKLDITGTPTFVLEDEMLRGYVPLDGMLALVDAVRG